MQIVHRVRLRAQRLVFRDVDWSRSPVPGIVQGFYRRPAQRTAWPRGFVPVDAQAPPEPTTPEQLSRRGFELVGEERTVGPGAWQPPEASQLWRYHLHYFEWAWALVGAANGRKVFAELWDDWRASTRLGRGDAWAPYVVSLRSWALCGQWEELISGSGVEASVRETLQWHAGFVLRNIELDVGGNHLVKNIKALVGLGVFLGDDKLVRRGRALLARELPVQVLPDGGHYERSPSYHAQVLGDLIDIHDLMMAEGLHTPPGLTDAIERMRRWLGHVLMPDGAVPLLRDCVPVSPERLQALAAARPAKGARLTVLAESGYVVVDTGRLHAVLDVGRPCPPRLPAHAQADTLNWVLHVDGAPVVVDTGTSSYQDVRTRAYERSTAAHNTVEIDGQNSTEVFGAFRAGRRPTVTLLAAGDDGETVTVTAEHDGYRFLAGAPLHRRTWGLSARELTVVDRVDGSGRHRAVSRTHLAVEPAAIGAVIRSEPQASQRTSARATRMGAQTSGVVLEAALEAELPLHLRLSITCTPAVRGE